MKVLIGCCLFMLLTSCAILDTCDYSNDPEYCESKRSIIKWFITDEY